MGTETTTGFLNGTTPYLKLGEGPPLVMVQGLTPKHDVPQGTERRLLARSLAPLAADFTVYSVNRKRGLELGESMSDIAGHLADAIENDLSRCCCPVRAREGRSRCSWRSIGRISSVA